MNDRDFARQLEILAVLDEPVRRRLYFHVAAAGDAVSRDEAAKAAGVGRALAAFHLDRLVEAGLLEASFARPKGRTGPGAGRPAKRYRRAGIELDVSLPRRRYELAAHILAAALARLPEAEALKLARAAARDRGAGMVEEGPRKPSGGSALRGVARALEECGFEPFAAAGGELALRNCPFSSLAAERRTVVCGMNLAFVEGLIEGLRIPGVEARLAPRPDGCCVELRSASAKPGA